MKKEITINLKEPVNYAPIGAPKKILTQALTIFCPTQKELASISVIDTAYSKYLNSSQKNIMDMFGINKLPPHEMTQKIEEFRVAFNKSSEKSEKDIFKLSDMKAHIEPKELTNCYGALQNILCGNAKLDEKTCINVITYKELTLFDLENILQEFIRNFIIRSPQS